MIKFIRRYFSCEKISTEIIQMDSPTIPPVLNEMQCADQLLQKIEYSDTIKYIPSISYGKVIKVYDGDTITVASKLNSNDSTIYRFSVRLLGIDSPEIKGKSETEKRLAKQSRDALYEFIYGKIVKLENVTTEKYGRILANVICDGINVSTWMLDNKFAISYDGGKKTIPDEWGE